MREDNLLGVQPRAFVVATDSNHDLEVYLNLASRMKLTGVNQLWVADITYIRLHREWVFLAVILDAFSRKMVGWEPIFQIPPTGSFHFFSETFNSALALRGTSSNPCRGPIHL
jgi:hypothetical protein